MTVEAGQVWQLTEPLKTARLVVLPKGTMFTLRMRMAGSWWLVALSRVEDTVVNVEEFEKRAQRVG